jgi:hypothetical protein
MRAVRKNGEVVNGSWMVGAKLAVRTHFVIAAFTFRILIQFH